MNFFKAISLLFVSLFSLNACVASNTNYQNSSTANNTNTYKPKPSANNGFTTEKWFLTKMNNAPYQGKRITLNLSSDKKANGFSGCNRYFISKVDVRGGQLSFGSVGSTRMLCRDAQGNQLEQKYLTILRGVSRFQKSDSRLVLEGRSGSLVFYKKSRR